MIDSDLDANVPIWRYMDFWKFADLLERATLWFGRADRLGDPWEGAALRYAPTSESAEAAAQRSRARQNLRSVIYISCWSEASGESAALWSQYTPSGYGVAIKSSVGSLSDALQGPEPPGKVVVRRVNYVDYSEQSDLDANDLQGPYFRKRKSFEHEHEVRLFTWWQGDWGSIVKAVPETPLGLRIPLDLRQVVQAVRVSPRASGAYLEAVRGLVARYGLPWSVGQSALDDPALF